MDNSGGAARAPARVDDGGGGGGGGGGDDAALPVPPRVAVDGAPTTPFLATVVLLAVCLLSGALAASPENTARPKRYRRRGR